MTEGSKFSWKDLGDTQTSRPVLGPMIPMAVYRLFQQVIRHVLTEEFDEKIANELLFKTGKCTGELFCTNYLNRELEIEEFITELQRTFQELKIGILKIEKLDCFHYHIAAALGECLECSGVPVSEKRICNYTEGFITGILKAYTGKEFRVRETDCRSGEDRICRFAAYPLKPP